MFGCLLGTGKAAKPGNAGSIETDFRRVELKENVAGGYDNLTGTLGRRRKAEVYRQLPVKEGYRQTGITFAGDGNEYLSARTVGGQALGIATGVHDEDTQIL